MNWSSALVIFSFTISVLSLSLLNGVEAKRGCATFGHSCYGAMGKRMSDSDFPNNEEPQEIQQQGNSDIVFTGPRKDDQIEGERKILLQQLYSLSPFVRQWVRSYRRAQELHDGSGPYY